MRDKMTPVFYQGQDTRSEPDHYVTPDRARQLITSHDAIPINRCRAILLLTTCQPRFPRLVPSIKMHWKWVGTNIHSFKFRRDYGAFCQPLGPRVAQLFE